MTGDLSKAMKKSELGSTGIEVSCLGLGTVKIGRNQQVKYPEPFTIPEDRIVKNLFAEAKALGINLIDTAPAYGESEARLGQLLDDRQAWVIVTKVGEEFHEGVSHYDFSNAQIIKSIERSLRRLKTDYLDCVLVHSDGRDIKIIEEEEVFSVLEALKKQGKIRSFGMSTKTVEGGKRCVDGSDVVMVTYNSDNQSEREVIDYAKDQKKGVLIKKALASGHLLNKKNSVKQAMQSVLKVKGVNSVIVGTINPTHLRENTEAANEC
jgi:aryl-alcohol dehydrogenase-like predicted oxidoreductase